MLCQLMATTGDAAAVLAQGQIEASRILAIRDRGPPQLKFVLPRQRPLTGISAICYVSLQEAQVDC